MTLLTPAWREAARARATQPGLEAARTALDERAAIYRRALPEIPTQQAGYYHDFFCPKHAVQLVYEYDSPNRHVCPVDGEVFSGEPFDSAWRWSVNDHLSDAALKLAFRSFLYRDEKVDTAEDVAVARRVLLGYAERYVSMLPPPVIHPTHVGVVTWSGLDESVWLIRMAWAHALLADVLSAADNKLIREGLLVPGAAHMKRERWPEIHNVTCWNNAAMATLAIALDDEALLADANDPPHGTYAQLAEGVLADGFWWEGSLSYHFYTLAALIWHARAMRSSGRTFDDGGVLHRMFAGPIGVAFPDLTLPAVHDCWYFIGLTGLAGHGIPDAAGFYEIANGWYGDDAFAWVLRQNYALKDRLAFESLLDGTSSIPDAPEPPFVSHRVAESGLAVLRSAEPRASQAHLILKASRDARDHGHPDQLHIQLFSDGVRHTADLGTPGYGIGLNDTWYRQTASHSTILIDHESQPIVTASLDYVRLEGDFAEASATVSFDKGSYAGVSMRRTILWRNNYFVDLFEVECDREREIDWCYQNFGTLIAAPDAVPANLPGECGYQHYSGVHRYETAGPASLRWQRAGAYLELSLPSAAGESVYYAIAPSNPASESLSAIVRRRRARRTLFAGIFVPHGAERVVESYGWALDGGVPHSLTVATGASHEIWTLDVTPGESRLRLE